MKYDHNRYADISAICKFLGTNICLWLPAVHAMIGRDTTLYLIKVEKVLKKLLETEIKTDLLLDLGKDDNASEVILENAKEC